MTQKEKQLLLIDLCARLPYCVKCECGKNTYGILGIYYTLNDEMEWEFMAKLNGFAEPISITAIKPYLRPLSSMTKEEYDELRVIDNYYGIAPLSYINDWKPSYDTIEWLNKHHFDYHGLINKKLAIEVTEENNPYKDND